jgi:hypothetical protein
MLSNFARAYQAELLRSNQQGAAASNRSMEIADARTNPAFSDILLTRLGDFLIDLGERLKGQNPCPELTHGQA